MTNPIYDAITNAIIETYKALDALKVKTQRVDRAMDAYMTRVADAVGRDNDLYQLALSNSNRIDDRMNDRKDVLETILWHLEEARDEMNVL